MTPTRVIRGLVLLAASPFVVNAQALKGADTLSPAAVAESAAVVRKLVQHLRGYPNDAVAWYRQGMAAWAITVRALAPDPPKGFDATRYGRMADSALRGAAALAPDSVAYRVAAGRYLYASGTPMTRSAAANQFEKAVKEARRMKHAPSLAQASLWYGRTVWGRYDAMANRHIFVGQGSQPNSLTSAMTTMTDRGAEALEQLMQLQAAVEQFTAENNGIPVTINQLGSGEYSTARVMQAIAGRADIMPSRPMSSFKGARELLLSNTMLRSIDVSGETDFQASFDAFHDAYSADPSAPGTFRALAMVYAEKSLWSNLEALAVAHVRRFPQDSLAWMTLGLARHRRQNEAGARAAFDSALRMMHPSERSRLDNWERVLKPGAGSTLTGGTEDVRAARERLYWLLANPLWLDAQATKLEFLARVTWAELRWTVEEVGLRGAQTDRGDVFVRYGPPNRIIALGPVAAEMAEVTTFWLWDSGLIVAFRGMPTFKTAHLPADDVAMIHALENLQPVRWDNVSAPTVDSLPAFAARFRHTPGTVDLIVAASFIPPDTIAKSMAVSNAVTRTFWLITPGTFTTFRSDSVVRAAGVQSWTQRVPAATYVYRAEEFGVTAMRGARATGIVDAGALGFPPLGFGISDILMTASTPSAASRVRDMQVTPIVGTIERSSGLTLVWENYELAARENRAEYAIAVTLERARGTAGRIAAEVLGAVANIARVANEDDRVRISFDRNVPHAAALADQITIGLGTTPSGTYTVIVEITDKATGQAVKRSTSLTIRD